MNKYKLASGGSPTQLVARVNQLLEEGWSLQGGVVAVANPRYHVAEHTGEVRYHFYQAMTFVKNEKVGLYD